MEDTAWRGKEQSPGTKHPEVREQGAGVQGFTYHDHDVSPAALVEIPYHVWIVLKVVLVEGEVSLGICII